MMKTADADGNENVKSRAYRGLVKVAVGFKLLEAGTVSRMTDAEVERLLEWLEE
jgi:hypothetical protein